MSIFNRSWSLEVPAMVLCMGCLCLTTTILFSMQDKPLSNWHPPRWLSQISLTATISVLSTISRLSLLFVVSSCISQNKWEYFHRTRPLLDFDIFDGASRGALGALMFLGKVSIHLLAKTATLGAKTATLGAIVTILAAVMDPSTQLVLELKPRLVSSDNTTASFSYSTIYDSGAHFAGGGPQSLLTQDNTMIGAVTSTLYGFKATLPFDCITANCSWPGVYTTLGFESKCTNVTTVSSRVCDTDIDGDEKKANESDNTQYCNITTPGGVRIQTRYAMSESRTAVNVSAACPGHTFTDGSDLAGVDPILTCTPYMNTSTISTFAVYRYSATDPSNFDHIVPWEVIECNLSVAAYTYSDVSVRNNNFNVGKTKITPLSPDPSNAGIIDFVNKVYVNFTGATDEKITFKINNADWFFLGRSLFSKVFRGGIAGGIVQYMTNPEGIGPNAFINANITDLSSNIAQSMTNRIRTSLNSTRVQGVAYTEVTFVNVRWPWFVVPSTTVLGAIACFLSTSIRNKKKKMASWKNSSVALLLHRVNGVSDEDRHEIRDHRELEKYAKNINVQVSKEGTLDLDRDDLEEEKASLVK